MSLRPLFASLTAAALLTASCASADPGTSAADPDEPTGEETAEQPVDEEGVPTGTTLPANAIIIGSVLAETGLMEPLDRPALQAARIQVDRLNEAGGLLGRPVVLRQVDSTSQLNETFQAAQDLISRDASMLMVTCDVDFALPALQLALEAGIPVISPCGGDPRWGDPGQVGPRVFSLAMPLDAEGALMADRAFARWGRTALVVVDDTNPDAIALCDGFEQRYRGLGGVITSRVEIGLEIEINQEEPAEGEEPVEPLAAVFGRVRARPDVAAMCAAPLLGQDLVLFMRRAGLQTPIVAGSLMDGDSWIVNVEDVGQFEMLSYASVFGDDPSAAVRELFDAYQLVGGARAGQGRPVTGADAIQAFAIAVERAGTLDGEAVTRALEAFDDVELVGGSVTFTPFSHISLRSMRVIEIIDDQPRFVEELTPDS